ncbi:MAG: DUF624 domain-containing protein [Caldilineaceae bacterium]
MRVGWRGLRHFLAQGWVYVWANVLWIALSLPIVTAPAAWAGMCHFSYHALRQPTTSFEPFWHGFRLHWRGGILVSLLGVALIYLTLLNLLGFSRVVGVETAALRIVWLLILAAWFGIQLYAFPLLPAMKQPALRGGYRNAGVMFVRHPFFTLGLWLFCLPILIISVVLPAAWLLITGGLLAAIGSVAVQDRLRADGIEQAPLEPPVSEPNWDGVS